MSNRLSIVGLCVFLAAAAAALALTVRGKALLSEQQKDQLSAGGPRLTGIVLLLAIFACSILGQLLSEIAIIPPLVLTLAWSIWTLNRLDRPQWPTGARRTLIAGRFTFMFGLLFFTFFVAIDSR